MKLKNPELFRQHAYINGKWLEASSGKNIEVHNPADLSLLGHIPNMGVTETQHAIQAAHQAWIKWRELSPHQRSKLLLNWHQLILANLEDLAVILTLEQGKSIKEARTEIQYGASFINWFAEEAKRIYGDIIRPAKVDQRIMVFKQAMGVVGAITPWNFPNAMITRKCAPALAAGCTVIVKPSEATPFSALALAVLAEKAGIPAGVFNMVTGDAQAIGESLCTSPQVQKIAFTGSTPIGKLLMQQSSSTLKKLSLELGGNAPFIVFEDADLDAAVEGALMAKFRNSGQTCICTNRFLIQNSIYEKFTQKLTIAVQQLRLGNGLDEQTQQGPLINETGVKKVEALIQDALNKKAQLICGGKRSTLGTSYFEPTVLTEMQADMRMCKEEIFGPVAALYRFDTEQQAIQMANDTEYGLASYIYSENLSRIWRVSENLEYGMVSVNSGLFSSEVLPFGGIKESGFGREGSKYGIEDYLTIKSVNLELNPLKN